MAIAVTTKARDCPLCVAGEKCEGACIDLWHQSAGSMYCLQACNGARPSDNFNEMYFVEADQRINSRAQLNAKIRALGEELAAGNANMK
eukprot:NODE_30257_length_423_cov_2.385135.p2 GENE.NODE_30257_length_423_cov_2.385135~~NODE_30257_length_423_cov_2.385135.p2  ORF type:complete len:104 (-),score=27.72 NODE_30257_length_423_cov_2.385135:111-377(-)